MKKTIFLQVLAIFLGVGFLSALLEAREGVDPLSSWNEGEVKASMVEFIESVSDPSHKNYVKPKHRIAVLDLDGTLLCENPVNFQRALAIKRLREIAGREPALRVKQPFQAAWFDDADYYNKKENHSSVFLKAFEGTSRDEYQAYIKDFLKKENAPHWGRPFQKLFYQPGLELVRYLEQKGFDVYICSTTEEECIRDLLGDVLDLRPVQVIGNEVEFQVVAESKKVEFVMGGGFEYPECRGSDKCSHVARHIGKPPIFAFGNSMGDCGFLRYSANSKLPHFEMILDHDDPDRELEYHDQEILGHAVADNWQIISMKRDFRQVFPEA